MGTTYGISKDRLAFSSGHLSARGHSYRGFQSITPSEEAPKEPVYGSGRVAVGRVKGPHKASCAFEILLSEWDALMHDLGGNANDVPFDLEGTFIEPGDGIFTVRVKSAEITKVEIKMSNDGKALVASCETSVTEPISWNGIYLIQQDLATFDATGFGLSISF